MRELHALPQIVSGQTPAAVERATALFRVLVDQIIPIGVEEAELAKLFTNTWRYIKFAAANQLYMIATDFGADFDVIRELGRGGMGVVYEAVQVSLSRRVALKVLGSGLGLTLKAVDRFRREAESAAKLHHTNIVPVYATGHEQGVHFYAMELIDGPSLDRVIRDLMSRDLVSGGRQPPELRLPPVVHAPGSPAARVSGARSPGTAGRTWRRPGPGCG